VTLSAASGTNIKISAGTQAELNTALALLRYTPDNNFYGTDFLTVMAPRLFNRLCFAPAKSE